MKTSITNILNELNSPFLIKWANKIGLQGIKLEDYRKKSTNDGINNHTLIQEKIKKDGEFKGYKLLHIEYNLDGDIFYGRCDFIAEKNGIVYIFDFKSNDKIYPNHIMQLLAYKKLYGECKIGIISLNNLEIKILELSKEEELLYNDLFMSLYYVYKNKKLLNIG